MHMHMRSKSLSKRPTGIKIQKKKEGSHIICASKAQQLKAHDSNVRPEG
jgi:hypothetical protein